MKKLILLGVATFALAATPVLADGYDDDDGNGTAVAISGSKANASNRNSNRNYNSDYNSNYNNNSNRAYGGSARSSSSVYSSDYNYDYNYDYQSQGQGQDQGQGQGQSANNEGVTGNSVTIEGDDYEAPILAPNLSALTATPGTCMGSSSISAGFAGFAGGLGSTWTDRECQTERAIRLAIALGADGLAIELLNDLQGVRAARERIAASRRGQVASATGGVVAFVPISLVAPAGRPYWCQGKTESASQSDRLACGL